MTDDRSRLLHAEEIPMFDRPPPTLPEKRPRRELPKCSECQAKRDAWEAVELANGRKAIGGPRVKRVRRDAFGRPLETCGDCTMKQAHDSLVALPPLAEVDPDRAKGRAHLKAVRT